MHKCNIFPRYIFAKISVALYAGGVVRCFTLQFTTDLVLNTGYLTGSTNVCGHQPSGCCCWPGARNRLPSFYNRLSIHFATNFPSHISRFASAACNHPIPPNFPSVRTFCFGSCRTIITVSHVLSLVQLHQHRGRFRRHIHRSHADVRLDIGRPLRFGTWFECSR
jgi:hypothetical protein